VKSGIVGLLEAASALLAEGYQPARTLMFAFGQDEESGGFAGAAHIAGEHRPQGQLHTQHGMDGVTHQRLCISAVWHHTVRTQKSLAASGCGCFPLGCPDFRL
jgi:acetylornithine deacetylase/succinyl-diaminopimelate desuccinylase-like protein